MTTIISICAFCKHFHRREDRLPEDTAEGLITCDAFQAGEGIPRAILFGGYDHRKPYPGDDGIMWEYNPDSETPEYQVPFPSPEDEKHFAETDKGFWGGREIA